MRTLTLSASLPTPGAEARAVSDTLLKELRTRIEQSDGCMPFDEFMETALYKPGLGYYSNGLTPFG
ncbi:MAG TPA: class I SAM-dependent methyltransferase, partial [Gammaproteobacteria bacterium]|nr:class I SAM-dependent methyltransferase [Gammaproteobacteria bacterium]